MSLIRRWAVRRQIRRTAQRALVDIPLKLATSTTVQLTEPAAVLAEDPPRASWPAATPIEFGSTGAPVVQAAEHDPGELGLSQLELPTAVWSQPGPPQPATGSIPDPPWELPQWPYRTRKARKSQRQQGK